MVQVRFDSSVTIVKAAPAPEVTAYLLVNGVESASQPLGQVPMGQSKPFSFTQEVPAGLGQKVAVRALAVNAVGQNTVTSPEVVFNVGFAKLGHIITMFTNKTMANPGETVSLTVQYENMGLTPATFRLKGRAFGTCVIQEGFTDPFQLQGGEASTFNTSFAMHPCEHDQIVVIQRLQDGVWMDDDSATVRMRLAPVLVIWGVASGDRNGESIGPVAIHYPLGTLKFYFSIVRSSPTYPVSTVTSFVVDSEPRIFAPYNVELSAMDVVYNQTFTRSLTSFPGTYRWKVIRTDTGEVIYYSPLQGL